LATKKILFALALSYWKAATEPDMPMQIFRQAPRIPANRIFMEIISILLKQGKNEQKRPFPKEPLGHGNQFLFFTTNGAGA
jgi:hypothetical protein